MRTFDEAFYWLQDARVANLCYRADDPSVGLALSKERASFKCYLADTGLLVTHTFADAGPVSEKAYRALLIDDIGINEGMLVENAIAQTLVAKGDRLFFYSQSGLKEGEERMEVDFLIARPFRDAALKPRVCPIEVKFLDRYRTTSLDRLKNTFGKRIGDEYVLHPRSLSVEGNRKYIPLYMAHLL
jgi:predicted AAA+ superfamily ATPase